MVSVYQGVKNIAMKPAGYAVPSRGTAYPGYFTGLLSSSSAYGQNPNSDVYTTASPILVPWSPITDLNSPIGTANAPASVFNFWLYQLTPTGLRTWIFSGGPELTAGQSNWNNLAFLPIIIGSTIYFAYKNIISGNRVLYGSANITSPGTITAQQVSIIQSGSLSANFGNLINFVGIGSDGVTPLMLFLDVSSPPTSEIWASLDFTQAINSYICPTGFLADYAVAIGYQGTNNVAVSTVSNSAFQLNYFSVAPTGTLAVTFGTQTTLTFDTDSTTGITLWASNSVASFAHYFPELGQWIMRGNTLSGSSGWYLVSGDFTQYWNLKFSAGPADPSFGMVVDSLSNIYTVDNSGNVFVSGTGPAPYYPPVSINQTPSFPLHPCFYPIRPRKVC